MYMNSARFTAGHFFTRTTVILLTVVIAGGCGGRTGSLPVEDSITGGGETIVLIEFPEGFRADRMPEGVLGPDDTAAGRFCSIDDPTDGNLIREFAEAADSSGLLILAVLREGQSFTGTRDHLTIWINEAGAPVRIYPEMETGLFADSLWLDPVIRQSTILELISFFKPDVAVISMTGPERCPEITAFWG